MSTPETPVEFSISAYPYVVVRLGIALLALMSGVLLVRLAGGVVPMSYLVGFVVVFVLARLFVVVKDSNEYRLLLTENHVSGPDCCTGRTVSLERASATCRKCWGILVSISDAHSGRILLLSSSLSVPLDALELAIREPGAISPQGVDGKASIALKSERGNLHSDSEQ